MIEQVFEKILNAPELGIFGLLFLGALWFYRKDSLSHKKDYQVVAKEMFDVVNRNTESSTKLSEAIKGIKGVDVK